MISKWIRGGRLGMNSISGYFGIGPLELWFGWLSRAPWAIGFAIFPGPEPVGAEFDYIFDLVLGRVRITLLWLGRRPEFWAR